MTTYWRETLARKQILGYLTIWPIFYFLIFFLIAILLAFSVFILHYNFPKNPIFIIVPVLVLFVAHLFTILDMLLLTIIYILDVVSEEALHQKNKIFWALAVFLSMFARPVYWYIYIWKSPQQLFQTNPKMEDSILKFSPIQKLKIAVSTLIPFLFLFLCLYEGFGFMLLVQTGSIHHKGELWNLSIGKWIACALYMLLFFVCSIGMMIYYIKIIIHENRFSQDKREFWIAIISLGLILTMPLYWYWYIWKKPEINSSLPV